MRANMVVFTKQIADHLLKYNTGNRPVKKTNIEYWEKCLKTNAVTLTHQGIAIAGTMQNPERLLDGQHRLRAISKTGIPMTAMLFEMVPTSAFMNLDNGVPRSMTDRTELLKQQSEVCVNFYYLSTEKGKGKPSVKQVLDIYKECSEDLASICATKVAGLSKTANRTAFVLQNHVFGKNSYSDFVGGNFDNLSPSLIALYKKILTDKSNKFPDAFDFVRAWMAIENPKKTRFSTIEYPFHKAQDILKTYWHEVWDISSASYNNCNILDI